MRRILGWLIDAQLSDRLFLLAAGLGTLIAATILTWLIGEGLI